MKWVCIALAIGQGFCQNQSIRRFPNIPIGPGYDAPAPFVFSSANSVGDITAFDFDQTSNTFEIESSDTQIRVQFYREDVVRIWLAWDGNFTDPASEIVVGKPQSLSPAFTDAGEYYEMRPSQASDIALRAAKNPLRFSMYRHGALVWTESQGLARGSGSSLQSLKVLEDEYFFGGGMQNGHWSHKGHKLTISADGNWDEGGNPNAVPFYVSSAGYGVYRNTWAVGHYDFTSSPAVLSHSETRFDAFYMVSAPRDYKALLGAYSFVTGPPYMPPIYALGMGDSDCYHNKRHGWSSHSVVNVADKYLEHDFPTGWFLFNDGYGCGYGDDAADDFPHDFDVLDDVVVKLAADGFETGLWSSTGIPYIDREVKGAGSRIMKTDCGWIGGGYQYAFDGVGECVRGIEGNSDARRFIWTVSGWAGTHRMATMWTGDNTGSLDYVRWQIPTFIGSGFSAQAHISGDIDGIFGGSSTSYVRDLQFKSMMTTIMTMSGWASNPDKQPWTYGEPYTSINRKYLQLKAKLTPYFYTLSREAYDTGVPPIRAMAMEFSNDTSTYTSHVGSTQQFMSGPSFLVAPVYTSSLIRDDIYLPAGEWVDYWDHSIHTGPTTINGYDAPLNKLPMFVRAGSIIPMWPEMKYSAEITLDVYPAGQTSFTLYEDDGKTRDALEQGSFAKTLIRCDAAANALSSGGSVKLEVLATQGSFTGQIPARSYNIQIHAPTSPSGVTWQHNGDRSTLRQYTSLDDLDKASSGWFFGMAPTPPPTPPAPTPSPIPSGVHLLHNGSACNAQTVNLGNAYEQPEDCAAAARGNSQCAGYFMHSKKYWDAWGCRCCTDDQTGQNNDAWNTYSYGKQLSSSVGNVVTLKLPSTAVSKSFSVELTPSNSVFV